MVIISCKMRWTEYVAYMDAMRNKSKISVRRAENITLKN